jgi:hypothetical protein
MTIYILNYSCNSDDYPYSGYKYFSSMNKALEGKKALIKEDEEWGELASSSKDGQYMIRIYTANLDI